MDSFSQPLGESRQQDILDRGTKTKRKMLVNLAFKHISLKWREKVADFELKGAVNLQHMAKTEKWGWKEG